MTASVAANMHAYDVLLETNMITAERILSDLERGFSFWSGWAPDVVDALVEAGRVEVRSGWVKPAGITRNEWRKRKVRGRRPYERARKRQDRARDALPCSVSTLAALLDLTGPGAEYVLRQVGATRVGVCYEPDKRGRRRARPVWGLR